MKCSKCEKEINDNSKFCNNCGEKIEERESIDQLDNIFRMCSHSWFILGYLWGTKKDDKKSLEEIERRIRSGPPELWDRYQELVAHMKESDKKHNEKDKKTHPEENSLLGRRS